MPGSTAANLHRGSRSEILADYFFSHWGTVTPVRWQDDYGEDLYCTMTEREGKRAWVRDYFVLQVKSNLKPWVFTGRRSVDWLVKNPISMFLACVDKKNGILRVYHVMPRFYVWALGKMPNRIELVPGKGENGEFLPWENRKRISLSAPIIQVTLSDFLNEKRMEQLRAVFQCWLNFDRDNCDLARFGLARFRMPHPYRTNHLPGSLQEAGLSIAPNRAFLDRGILTLAEAAECIGGQLGVLDDRKAALLACLLVRHLTSTCHELFEKQPRWSGGFMPGDLGRIVCQRLNHLLTPEQLKYYYSGLDQIFDGLLAVPLVKEFLSA